MCGIAGFVAPPGVRADPRVIERMIGTLRHRGPDAVGHFVDGRVALGVARLRVIDLATGDQPLANEDGSIQVVLNGEIYNFVTLRERLQARGYRFATRSDTEVISHGWEDEGEASLQRLNGMFAFAVWNRREERLVVARDRMGEKPLYYASAQGWLVFASELRAVLSHPAVSRELDLEGVSRYLAFDYVPDPHTMIRGVNKLPPGHLLSAVGATPEVRRYWDIPYAPEPEVNTEDWCAEIRRRLDDAVRLRLVSDVALGCFMSGGIDSTAIAATAARLHPGIRTFSVGYTEPRFDERPFARLAAERLGTRHEELLVTPEDARALLPDLGALLDEPIADMSFLPLYLLSRAARRSVTVALTGDGGDELFGGYPSMAAEWWHRNFAALPSGARSLLGSAAEGVALVPEPLRDFLHALEYRPAGRNQALVGGLPPARHRSLFSPDTRERLGEFDPYADADTAVDACVSADPRQRLIYQYCKLYLAGQNLANADRASMAVGLELRAPFLDHRFVEFVGRIPASRRLGGLGQLKALLKRALTDRLPREILARGKQGFGVPMGEWLRGPLEGILRGVLSPERLRRGGTFEPARVQQLVTEHVSGSASHRKLLWSLLVFELWREQHLDAGAPA
jgi:asparagine synthase (glutamine-hydrolysing)